MHSLKEFIDNAKANPGKVTFATPGIGTTPHLTAELFKQMAGSTSPTCPIAAWRLAR